MLEWTAVNKSLPAPSATPLKSPEILSNLPDCWIIEMSKRLSGVVVEIVVRKTEGGWTEKVRVSSIVVTKLHELGHWTKPEKFFWRLKPGQWLDEDIINAHLELLHRSVASPNHRIVQTFTTEMHDQPYRWFTKVINTVTHTVCLPFNQNNSHWIFAVITTRNKEDALRWTYYDNIGDKPPVASLV
ncbi:hypothetical protein BJ878DRAFT_193647 [Calycina marina]|uniref:Ubiquitin-like protease family profile domain-containing protein n=1 Tax=Calycina marina TaxID=1763456 RepID=A0A9P7YYE4_9HELO|nr:hypothetical protein BJ878DRAFT_193647 [Calycina marina]